MYITDFTGNLIMRETHKRKPDNVSGEQETCREDQEEDTEIDLEPENIYDLDYFNLGRLLK